jgi:hypothetical protein
LGDHYELLQAETVLMRVAMFWTPSIQPPAGQTPGDFALLVEEAGNTGKYFLVRSQSIQDWGDPMIHHNALPALWNGKLLSLQRTDNPGRIDLLDKLEIIYTQYLDSPAIDEPVKGLWSWNGHWVLEVAGQIIIDGQSLNQQMGYSEAFGWQLLDGQPFYFFVKDGKTSLWYGDAPLAAQFDEVIHYRCCEPAAFNNGGNSRMAWFYARRAGMWEYVEIGKYGE